MTLCSWQMEGNRSPSVCAGATSVSIPTETGDQTEGTSGCMRERYDGEIGCGRTTTPSTGGDISTGQGQMSRGTTAEGGPVHPDDTCRGALQPGQRAGDPGLLDRIDEETGREGRSSPTFDLQ